MIRMFCKELPFDLSRMLFTEYESRKKEVDYRISGDEAFYARYIPNRDSVYLLLAMSIYYKRVVAQLDAMSGFQENLRYRWKIGVLRIGKTVLTSEDAAALTQICNDFHRIMSQFNIPLWLFDWSDAMHFLGNIVMLADHLKRINEALDG